MCTGRIKCHTCVIVLNLLLFYQYYFLGFLCDPCHTNCYADSGICLLLPAMQLCRYTFYLKRGKKLWIGNKNNYINLKCSTKQSDNKLKWLRHECERKASLPFSKSAWIFRACGEVLLQKGEQANCLFCCLPQRKVTFRFYLVCSS